MKGFPRKSGKPFSLLYIGCRISIVLVFKIIETDEDRILSDPFDIAPRNYNSVFGRKRGEKPVARQYYRGYIARTGVEFDITYATERTAVTKIYNVFVAKFTETDCLSYQRRMHIKPPLPSLIIRCIVPAIFALASSGMCASLLLSPSLTNS